MRRKMFAAATAGALLLVACGDDGGDDDAGAGAPDDRDEVTFDGEITLDEDGRLLPAECEGENVANEAEGVTEDTINVASINIDFAALADIGFAASDRDVNAAFQTFIDEVNDNGGVCGRTIDVQSVVYDIVQGDGGPACVEATEDRDNLLVTTSGYEEVLCVTDAGVPVAASNDVTEEEMADADGLLLTRYPSVEDQYRAVVEFADAEGALDGPVGVWYGGIYPNQTDTVEEVVLPLLDDLGVDYIDFRTDAVGPSDPEGNTVLTAAAAEFVSQDVETVLSFVQNTNHTGIQTELDAQGVSPRHISMPISGNVANELFADRFDTREIADGQEFITFSYGSTESEEDTLSQACHEIWTERTGEEIGPGTFDYSTLVGVCVHVDELVAALSLGGGDVDRNRLVQAYEQVPAHAVPPVLGELDWTPDNHFGPPTFSVHDYDGESNTVTTSDDIFEIDS